MNRMTFKDYLSEEDEIGLEDDRQLFNFNTFKMRLLPRVEDAIAGTHEYENIPGHMLIEILDMQQLIKQMVIDAVESGLKGDELVKQLKVDIKQSLKILYPNANVTELFNVINKEIIGRIRKLGVENVARNLDTEDLTMDSKDDFGQLMYRIFHSEYKKLDDVEQNELAAVKRWDDKLKITGETLNAKARNRKILKDKLFNRIENKLDDNDELIDEPEDEDLPVDDLEQDELPSEDEPEERKGNFGLLNHLKGAI